jgi:hypothetical protein
MPQFAVKASFVRPLIYAVSVAILVALHPFAFAAMGSGSAGIATSGQRHPDAPAPDQSSVAIKTGPKTVKATSKDVLSALGPKDLTKAAALEGKKAFLIGTIANVYSPADHGIVILDFDPDYHHTITAVARPESYAKLPDLAKLNGQKVLVSGKPIDYHGKPEFILTSSDQVKLVK